jgi:hypothetical protein
MHCFVLLTIALAATLITIELVAGAKVAPLLAKHDPGSTLTDPLTNVACLVFDWLGAGAYGAILSCAKGDGE